MATKRYNQENFYIEMADGRTLAFYCWTTNTRMGFCHTCWCSDTDQTTKIGYCNRTWESYRYQSVLQKAFNKLPKADRTECEKWDKTKVKGEQEKCDAFLSRFKSAYNELTDGQKQTLADSDIHITNEEQAESVTRTMEMIGAFNKLLG